MLRDLKLDDPLVISSPRNARWITAELAGLTVDEVSPLLAEWDYGDYEGADDAQIQQIGPDWLVWTHGCPGGESVAQVSERADRAIAMALEHMESRDVVFVGPRPLLPRGDHPMGRAAARRGQPLRDGRRPRSRCAGSSTACASSPRSG